MPLVVQSSRLTMSCLLSAGKFLWYLLFTLLTLLYYTFYGLLAVVLSPNLQVSSVASTLFFAIWNIFSGFLITIPQMPVRFYGIACLLELSQHLLPGTRVELLSV